MESEYLVKDAKKQSSDHDTLEESNKRKISDEPEADAEDTNEKNDDSGSKKYQKTGKKDRKQGQNNVSCLKKYRIEESINDDSCMDVQHLDDSMISWPSTSLRSNATPVPSAATSKKKGLEAEILKKLTAIEENFKTDTKYCHEYYAKTYEVEVRKFHLLERFVKDQKEIVKDQKEMKNAIVNYCNHAIRRDQRLE